MFATQGVKWDVNVPDPWLCRCGEVVSRDLPKVELRVRFPSPAPSTVPPSRPVEFTFLDAQAVSAAHFSSFGPIEIASTALPLPGRVVRGGGSDEFVAHAGRTNRGG